MLLDIPSKQDLFDFDALRTGTHILDYKGYKIAHIEVLILPIFNLNDPKENNAFYRFVNQIHAPTQNYVVRRQLLFSQGEILDPQLVAESERLLRTNSYFADAAITIKRVCGNSVDLIVVTRELWTLLPKLFISRKGGSNTFGLTVEDENILGTGNILTFQFIDERERDSQSIAFSTKQLVGSRVRLNAEYSNTTDGFNKEFEITRPFYSLNTRWSLGVRLQENQFEETLEAGGDQIDAFDHQQNEYQLFAGYSTGLRQGFSRRITFGFTRSEDLFDTNQDSVEPVPDDRILVYPWIKYAVNQDAFTTYRNLNALYRTEDVPIGINANALLGYADPVFDSALSQWLFSLQFSNVPYTWPKHLTQLELGLDGRWDRDEDDFQNTVFSVELDYHWLFADKLRFFAGLSYDHGINLTRDELLALSGDEGLRGYPSEFLLGERRLLLNIEQRYFFASHVLNLLRFAGVLFVDIGQTIGSDKTTTGNSNLVSSAGIGVRINSSKTSLSRIVHLDLAFPLNKRSEVDDFQLRITSSSTF